MGVVTRIFISIRQVPQELQAAARPPASPERAIWRGTPQAGAAREQGESIGTPGTFPSAELHLSLRHSGKNQRTICFPPANRKHVSLICSPSFPEDPKGQLPFELKESCSCPPIPAEVGGRGTPLCFLVEGGERQTGYKVQKPSPAA